jgi:hypothetical protein
MLGPLNRATSAARRVDTPAGPVAREVLRAVFTVKSDCVGVGLQLGGPGVGVVNNKIPGVYPGAG